MNRNVILAAALIAGLAPLAFLGEGQIVPSPGSITVNPPTPGTVVAQSPATSPIVVCTVTPNALPPATAVNISCTVAGATVTSGPVTPPIGNATGYTLAVNGTGGNSVTLMLTQATAAGPINWSIAANGSTKSGSF